MAHGGNLRREMKLRSMAHDAYRRGDSYTGRMASRASMDEAFGRDPHASLSSLMRSDDPETVREASRMFWDNFHDQMRRD